MSILTNPSAAFPTSLIYITVGALIDIWMIVAAQEKDFSPEALRKNGKPIVLADAVHGHVTAIVAGFSREGGTHCGEWVKALHADAALANVDVYQVAMLAGAPGFIRGMIKSAMKKGVPPAQQDHFVVLTEDEKLWRSYFDVSAFVG